MKDNDLKRGIQEYLKGEPEMAIEVLSEYLSNNDDTTGQAYFYRGLAHYDLGDFPEAVSDIKRAIEINPNYSQYYFRLGMAYSRMFQHNEGIKALEKAIKMNNKNTRAKFLLGTLYFEIGEISKASEIFKNIIKTNKSHTSAKYYYALSCYYLGKQDEAVSILKEIISINPMFVDAYIKLIDIYIRNSAFDDAKEIFILSLKNSIKSVDFSIRVYEMLVEKGIIDKSGFIDLVSNAVTDIQFLNKIIEVLNDTKKIKEVGYVS
ncbi:MAG: tetratricopeptide repeat protein [Calditerrivibrio sp.]|nr:tetratricopeptide repeat protein [Calditerrivibrio sp.]